ncbi:MAG TPA: glycosyltransferase family 39 protein [Candidatus Binataceae bacterium]|nr:glycosyltransferase family 39 protein [Candidatus Binataceae bacterium]
MLIVLAIPRVVRIFYPAIWIEDDFYAESAWLVGAGLRPYLDFVHPHFPLLEYFTASYLKVFGASHFSIEVLNEAAIYVTSLLTFKLAARVATRRAAIGAAILYATSALVFRYHVYERECFVAPLILVAAIFAVDENPRLLWIAIALVAACLIKLTAIIEVGVIVAFVAIVQRRSRAAIALAATVAITIVIATALCYAIYGREFFFQTFIFHFMKGRSDFLSVLAYPLAILDLQLPLFVVGCIAVGREVRSNRALILVLAMVGAEYLFYCILSPTSWGHNYLEPLPFVAVVSGAGLHWLIQQFEKFSLMPLAGYAAFVIISLIWIAPLENENWLRGSVYGFGFVPRDEVSRIATALREATRPDEAVLAPSFICFEANRRELIRFPETYGVLREAETEYERDGFAQARARLGNEDFVRLIMETSHFWSGPIVESIQNGNLNTIVFDSRIQLLPLVVPELTLPADLPQVLVDNGFRPIAQTEHFELWRRVSQSNAPPAAP